MDCHADAFARAQILQKARSGGGAGRDLWGSGPVGNEEPNPAIRTFRWWGAVQGRARGWLRQRARVGEPAEPWCPWWVGSLGLIDDPW